MERESGIYWRRRELSSENKRRIIWGAKKAKPRLEGYRERIGGCRGGRVGKLEGRTRREAGGEGEGKVRRRRAGGGGD